MQEDAPKEIDTTLAGWVRLVPSLVPSLPTFTKHGIAH